MLGVILDEHSGWLIAYIEAGCDEKAERELKRAGWRVYFPTYQKLLRGVRIVDGRRVRTRDAGDLVPRPLLAGYGFIAWDETDEIEGRPSVRNARGVFGVMMNGERPAIAPDRGRPRFKDSRGRWHPPTFGVEDLREFVNAGLFDDAKPGRKEPRKDIQPGNIVTLTTGPFAAFRARLEGVDENNRARVLLDLFNAPGRLLRDVDADTLVLAAAQ